MVKKISVTDIDGIKYASRRIRKNLYSDFITSTLKHPAVLWSGIEWDWKVKTVNVMGIKMNICIN